MKEKELEAYFGKFGDVSHIELPMTSSESNKGFAFIVFSSEEECQAALKESRHVIQGRSVIVSPFRQSRETIEGKVFMTGLSDAITGRKLKAELEKKFGTVSSVQIICDKQTGQSRGHLLKWKTLQLHNK